MNAHLRSSAFELRLMWFAIFLFLSLLTARCENYLVGRPDLKDTIERLQMYQEAGADVLYAPGSQLKKTSRL